VEAARLLRVMSANCRCGRADSGALVELIRRYQVDVLALQELGEPQAERVLAELPHGTLCPERGAEGTGLALRRPARMSQVPTAFRPIHVAHLAPSHWPGLGGEGEIATTHFAAPHVRPLGSGFRTRRRQLRDLEGYLARAGSVRRVLIGDFNATPGWPAYRRIASHLTDAAAALASAQGTTPEPTWGPWPSSRRWLRIDHAFVSGWRPVGFEVLGLAGSDHDAIVIDLVSLC